MMMLKTVSSNQNTVSLNPALICQRSVISTLSCHQDCMDDATQAIKAYALDTRVSKTLERCVRNPPQRLLFDC